MRPYLAIIKDSFREAIASRVLWVLLSLILVHLILLAPLGIKLNLTTDFVWRDIGDARIWLQKCGRTPAPRNLRLASGSGLSSARRIAASCGTGARMPRKARTPSFFKGSRR